MKAVPPTRQCTAAMGHLSDLHPANGFRYSHLRNLLAPLLALGQERPAAARARTLLGQADARHRAVASRTRQPAESTAGWRSLRQQSPQLYGYAGTIRLAAISIPHPCESLPLPLPLRRLAPDALGTGADRPVLPAVPGGGTDARCCNAQVGHAHPLSFPTAAAHRTDMCGSSWPARPSWPSKPRCRLSRWLSSVPTNYCRCTPIRSLQGR